MNNMRVAHIITGLNTGGAEMMLCRLIKEQQKSGIVSKVYALVSDGDLKPVIQAMGVDVMDLNFSRHSINLRGILQLTKDLHKWKPDVVLCWMYHANLIGSIAAKLAGRLPLLWNIRNSNLDVNKSSKTTIRIMQLGGILSFLPDQIISCSEVARDVHIQHRYQGEKFVIIPNGFDTDLFKPNHQAREKFCAELNIESDVKLVGIIGRYDPQKDFPTFLQAAGDVSKALDHVHFILCGQKVNANNTELLSLIEQAGIKEKVHLLGRRSDIQQVHQALDILVSSSAYGEAFPNVVAEAMACGVLCVATDVGDAQYLIGETGIIVPPQNPQAISDGIIKLFSLPIDQWNALKQSARKRISDHFSLPIIARMYADVFEENRKK